jgi:hypothetical protein
MQLTKAQEMEPENYFHKHFFVITPHFVNLIIILSGSPQKEMLINLRNISQNSFFFRNNFFSKESSFRSKVLHSV